VRPSEGRAVSRRVPEAAPGRLPRGRERARGALPRQGRGGDRGLPRRGARGPLPRDAVGRLVQLLGHRRRQLARPARHERGPARRRGRARRPRVPAARADRVQPARQRRDLRGLHPGRGRGSGTRDPDLAGAEARPSPRELRRGRRRRRAALPRRARPLPDAHGHLQRRHQPGDGRDRPALRAARGVRGRVPRARRGRAGSEPARRPHRPDEARSAADQPRAAVARARRRLPEGRHAQCARRVLDPVPDARLVLAPRRRTKRSRRPRALRRRGGSAALRGRRGQPSRARAEDDAQHRHGLVGRVPDLRLRRDGAPARESAIRATPPSC
jgi:hypothetical protein